MAYSQRKATKQSISLVFALVTAATILFSAVSACDDIPPSPEHTCKQQAIEWKKCGEPWMKDKCNESCGRCKGGEGAPPKPGGGGGDCDDVAPGPEHTCQQQAEWKKCDEPWMKDKCKKSCGRCVEGGGAAPKPSGGDRNKPTPKPEGGANTAFTTRYWDCSKPHCGWKDNAGSVTRVVKGCAKDGKSPVGDDEKSVFEGGSSAACNNQQPWKVSDSLSYGFAAAKLEGKACCACYELTFTNDTIKGKKMRVQVTNTGHDLQPNQFDLQIPGGGVGLVDGCKNQFGGGWGVSHGGIAQASDCNKLPKSLQDGCRWRFEWFKGANNPSVKFKEIKCPRELWKRTGCRQNK